MAHSDYDLCNIKTPIIQLNINWSKILVINLNYILTLIPGLRDEEKIKFKSHSQPRKWNGLNK